MPTETNETYFIEACKEHHSAFGVEVEAHVHSEQTPFQTIDIYASKAFGNVMAIDGFFMLTQRENFFYHEMMAHPVLLTHPNPKRVVIIGGGDCGTLREVLKHPGVEKAQQIEIDERVTRLAEEYFPELCESNNDPRAELLFIDGIAWMKEAEPDSIDIIIVDSTDPIGPAEGLFSAAFYRDCLAALAPNGILVQQSESPLYHTQLIKDMHQAMQSAGFTQQQLVLFPQPCYPSGWWSATMATKEGDLTQFRTESLPFETRYYTADIHRGALAIPPYLTSFLNK